jgi:glycosyltransferase involved in cell wall biosynthesis
LWNYINLSNPIAISKSKLKVSILLTVFNQKNFVERAIRSVVNQTYENIEIIIGDDCSTDGYEFYKMVGSHNDKIKYFRNEQNLGRSANYRKLLRAAQGEYVTILNADDFFISDDYIEKAVNLLEKPEVVLVFAQTKVYIEQKDQYFSDDKVQSLPQIIDGNWLFLNQVNGYIIPHVSSIYKRKQAIGLDFYRSKYMSQDWESLLRLIQGNKVGFVKEASAVYGRHTNNVSKTLDIDYLMNSDEFIINSYEHALSLNQRPKEVLLKWKNDMLFRFFSKNLIKIKMWKPDLENKYLSELQKRHSAIAEKLKADIRIKIFNWIKGSDLALVLVFKFILRQEGVIRDFLQAKNTRGKQD